MAFFDVPKDEDLPPEALRMFEDYRHVRGGDAGRIWRVFGRSPRIFEARLRAYENLSDQCPFSWEARSVAVMLIAHAKRCQACFVGARQELDKLGFDEEQLDTMCAHPETLPLKEGDRLFVRYALKIATGSADLTPKDFREMEASGFSKDEIQAMIGFAAYWTMNMVFNQAALAALTDDQFRRRQALPFFEPVPEEQLPPESLRHIDMARKRANSRDLSPFYFACAAHPKLLQAYTEVGYDEAAFDGYCQAPATLPLPERDLRMVDFTVRVACERKSATPADFREMEKAGFSKEELLEMIGIASFWNLATTFGPAMDAGLREE